MVARGGLQEEELVEQEEQRLLNTTAALPKFNRMDTPEESKRKFCKIKGVTVTMYHVIIQEVMH